MRFPKYSPSGIRRVHYATRLWVYTNHNRANIGQARSRWKHLVPLLQATSRRFSLRPPDSLALLTAGGLCVAGELGEPGIRWVLYISPPIRVHLARLELGSFPSMMATRRRVHPGGLGFRRPVLLSLQSISGDCGVGGGSFGDVAVRYVYSYLEKSGWSLIPTCFGGLSFLRDYSSSGDSGSPVNLEASDPMSPDDVMATSHLL